MLKISAVIPTRGDVDMRPIVAHLKGFPEITEVLVLTGDTVFNRYRAAKMAENEIIYTQDDDCITDIRPIIDAYEPGIIVNAMTPQHAERYPRRQTLIGFGAIFDRWLIDVLKEWEDEPLFLSKCDRIFTTLNQHKTVFPKIESLPCATAKNRLYRQPGYYLEVASINARIFERTGIIA